MKIEIMEELQLDQLRNAIEELPQVSRALVELGVNVKKLCANDVSVISETLLIIKAAEDLAKLLKIPTIDNEIKLIRQFDHIYISESYFHTYDYSIGIKSIHFFLMLVKAHVENIELMFTFRGNTFMSLQYLHMLQIMANEFPTRDWTKKKITNLKYTYIMYDSNTGYYKIGRSKNPHFRERTLLSVKPTISLIGHCPQDIERELHVIYDTKRIRGEWFSLSETDIEDIINKYAFITI